MQRLFSTFADGWPGVGLLLQRILTAALLVHFGIFELTGTSFSASTIPLIVAGCAGILVLVGLWTSIVGTLIAVIEIWIAVTRLYDPWISIILATLCGTAAMIGPGRGPLTPDSSAENTSNLNTKKIRIAPESGSPVLAEGLRPQFDYLMLSTQLELFQTRRTTTKEWGMSLAQAVGHRLRGCP